MITNLVKHYKDNPAVIGWQIDNETGSNGDPNDEVFAGFVEHLKQKLSQYKLVIVPALNVADDALLKKIADYMQGGGHVLMTFKSGFTNENSAVRWELAPGPLREAAGFTYQEFSNLEHPLGLKGDPFHVGAKDDTVSTWAEFLQPTTAKPLAFYDHAFFGRWPAITRNQFRAMDCRRRSCLKR